MIKEDEKKKKNIWGKKKQNYVQLSKYNKNIYNTIISCISLQICFSLKWKNMTAFLIVAIVLIGQISEIRNLVIVLINKIRNQSSNMRLTQ